MKKMVIGYMLQKRLVKNANAAGSTVRWDFMKAMKLSVKNVMKLSKVKNNKAGKKIPALLNLF